MAAREDRTLPAALAPAVAAALVEWAVAAVAAVAGSAGSLGTPAPPLHHTPADAVAQAVLEAGSSSGGSAGGGGGGGTPLLASLARAGSALPGRPAAPPWQAPAEALQGGLGGPLHPGGTRVTALQAPAAQPERAWKAVNAFSFRV